MRVTSSRWFLAPVDTTSIIMCVFLWLLTILMLLQKKLVTWLPCFISWIYPGSPSSRPGPPGDGAVPWSGSVLWEGWAVGSGLGRVPPGESCIVWRAGGHRGFGTVLSAAASSHIARCGTGGSMHFFLFSWFDIGFVQLYSYMFVLLAG